MTDNPHPAASPEPQDESQQERVAVHDRRKVEVSSGEARPVGDEPTGGQPPTTGTDTPAGQSAGASAAADSGDGPDGAEPTTAPADADATDAELSRAIAFMANKSGASFSAK